MILRDYQTESINQLRQAMAEGFKRPVLQLSTGAGKTIIAGAIIKMALEKGKKVAFIVDRLQLLDQASAQFDKAGIDHGIIQAKHPRSDDRKSVQIISAQTMARRKPWLFDLAIVDESHILHTSHKNLMIRWNNIPFIGISATPFTKGLGKYFDKLINPISIRELIEQGYLVNADFYGPSKPDLTGVKITAGDFNAKELVKRTNTKVLVANIVDTWFKKASSKQTICFACNIEHSKFLVSEFKNAGVNAEHIDAYTETKERKETIDKFKRNEITLLSSVGVLTTGFDAPNAEVGILARPTKSLSLHIQMIGRLLRPSTGKENALILDHAGNVERLGFHTDPTPDYLDDGEKGKQKHSEPLPKPCPQCAFLKPPKTSKCPKCGFESKRENKVYEVDGELKPMMPGNNYHEYTFYRELLGYAKERNFQRGWAYHKFNEKFGKYPKFTGSPLTPGEEVKKFIQHLNIRRAKRKKIKECKYCGGKSFKEGVGKGPHEASVICQSCNKFLGWMPKK